MDIEWGFTLWISFSLTFYIFEALLYPLVRRESEGYVLFRQSDLKRDYLVDTVWKQELSQQPFIPAIATGRNFSH